MFAVLDVAASEWVETKVEIKGNMWIGVCGSAKMSVEQYHV